MQRTYDYIIAGGGASGLYLAATLANHPVYKDRKGIIIDPRTSYENDRTWCYWEAGIGPWDSITFRQWNDIVFKNSSSEKTISLSPYQYKMIRSKEVYDLLFEKINANPNIGFCQEKVLGYADEGVRVLVTTDQQTYSVK